MKTNLIGEIILNLFFNRQSLYDNEQHIQEYFALFWQQVAEKFKQNPYVLGEQYA